VSEVDCQRRGSHSAAVVKLNLIRLIGRSNLTVPLQLRDFINERGMRPGLSGSSGLCVRDDVGCCLFDHAEPDELQLTDDRGLPCTGRAGYNEPSHVVSFLKAKYDHVLASLPRESYFSSVLHIGRRRMSRLHAQAPTVMFELKR